MPPQKQRGGDGIEERLDPHAESICLEPSLSFAFFIFSYMKSCSDSSLN